MLSAWHRVLNYSTVAKNCHQPKIEFRSTAHQNTKICNKLPSLHQLSKVPVEAAQKRDTCC